MNSVKSWATSLWTSFWAWLTSVCSAFLSFFTTETASGLAVLVSLVATAFAILSYNEDRKLKRSLRLKAEQSDSLSVEEVQEMIDASSRKARRQTEAA